MLVDVARNLATEDLKKIIAASQPLLFITNHKTIINRLLIFFYGEVSNGAYGQKLMRQNGVKIHVHDLHLSEKNKSVQKA